MSFAFGTNSVCVFLYGLYAVHFIFPGRKHSCISVLHGSKAKGSEVRRQIGDKWCPLLASVLHFKADVLPSVMSKTVQGFFFFSNGKIWGILVVIQIQMCCKDTKYLMTQHRVTWLMPVSFASASQWLKSHTEKPFCDDICSVMNFVILVHPCLHLQFPCVLIQ